MVRKMIVFHSMWSFPGIEVGIDILCQLGLNEEEADELRASRSRKEKRNTVRDQAGIGFTNTKPDFAIDVDNIYARLAAAAKVAPGAKPPDNTTAKPTQHQNRFYIPSRLKKKTVKSLSQEDLANILASKEPTSPPPEPEPTNDEKTEPNVEKQHHRRRRHHHSTVEENNI